MSKLISISKNANPNYLAKVVRITNLRKHSNADKLNVTTIDGNNIITSTSTPAGQLSIYFPLECQIAHEYLSINNDYRKTSGLNADPEAPGGFFEDKRRVKAVKLRGEKSEGYVVPVETLKGLIGDRYSELEQYIGEEFDTIGDLLLVKKYVVKRQEGSGSLGGNPNQKIKKSKILDKQFNFHYDTAQLGKNLHRIQPDSIISLSWKLHGTSFVSSKVLCARPLKWYERALKWLGIRISDTEYANIYSSRKVIKNDDITKNAQHYYGYDLWKDINDKLQANLHDGETIYGEAVGYTADGGFIQKGYDYGCQPKQSELYVYRITHTNASGVVVDLPFNLMQERCVQLGVNSVPFIYYGPAKQFVSTRGNHSFSKGFSMLSDEEWREKLLQHLKDKYVYDQDCQFCKTKVPAEGIVLRIEGLKPEAFKLKAFRFLERETKELDKGEVDIESTQIEEVNE